MDRIWQYNWVIFLCEKKFCYPFAIEKEFDLKMSQGTKFQKFEVRPKKQREEYIVIFWGTANGDEWGITALCMEQRKTLCDREIMTFWIRDSCIGFLEGREDVSHGPTL